MIEDFDLPWVNDSKEINNELLLPSITSSGPRRDHKSLKSQPPRYDRSTKSRVSSDSRSWKRKMQVIEEKAARLRREVEETKRIEEEKRKEWERNQKKRAEFEEQLRQQKIKLDRKRKRQLGHVDPLDLDLSDRSLSTQVDMSTFAKKSVQLCILVLNRETSCDTQVLQLQMTRYMTSATRHMDWLALHYNELSMLKRDAKLSLAALVQMQHGCLSITLAALQDRAATPPRSKHPLYVQYINCLRADILNVIEVYNDRCAVVDADQVVPYLTEKNRTLNSIFELILLYYFRTQRDKRKKTNQIRRKKENQPREEKKSEDELEEQEEQEQDQEQEHMDPFTLADIGKDHDGSDPCVFDLTLGHVPTTLFSLLEEHMRTRLLLLIHHKIRNGPTSRSRHFRVSFPQRDIRTLQGLLTTLHGQISYRSFAHEFQEFVHSHYLSTLRQAYNQAENIDEDADEKAHKPQVSASTVFVAKQARDKIVEVTEVLNEKVFGEVFKKPKNMFHSIYLLFLFHLLLMKFTQGQLKFLRDCYIDPSNLLLQWKRILKDTQASGQVRSPLLLHAAGFWTVSVNKNLIYHCRDIRDALLTILHNFSKKNWKTDRGLPLEYFRGLFFHEVNENIAFEEMKG